MNLNPVLITLPLLLFLPTVIDVEGLLHGDSLGGGEDAAVHHPDVKIKMEVVSVRSNLQDKISCNSPLSRTMKFA